MELYLMQHGPNFSVEKDPEEGLTPEGEKIIHASGKALSNLGIKLDLILSSTKKRSKETAAIIAEELRLPSDMIFETEKVKAMATAEDVLQALLDSLENVPNDSNKRVLIAGHLPSLIEISSHLLSESKVTIDFERGGCVRIDVENFSKRNAHLKWALLPDHLRKIS